MAVKIRLKRFGKKRNPIYRVVIMDSRVKRDGKTIEEIGQYIPGENPTVFTIDEEKVKAWLSKGAQPTDTVARLLAGKGLFEKPIKDSTKSKAKKQEVEDAKKAEADAKKAEEKAAAKKKAEEAKAEEVKEVPKEEAKAEEPKEEAKAKEEK
jgi:small subunit ribosomal protein S16